MPDRKHNFLQIIAKYVTITLRFYKTPLSSDLIDKSRCTAHIDGGIPFLLFVIRTEKILAALLV